MNDVQRYASPSNWGWLHENQRPSRSSSLHLAVFGELRRGYEPQGEDDPYALICRLEYKTGTRLVTVRRCLTKDQWDDARRQNRLDIDRFQSIRYKNF